MADIRDIAKNISPDTVYEMEAFIQGCFFDSGDKLETQIFKRCFEQAVKLLNTTRQYEKTAFTYVVLTNIIVDLAKDKKFKKTSRSIEKMKDLLTIMDGINSSINAEIEKGEKENGKNKRM